MQVNPVEQRTRNSTKVILNLSRRASGFTGQVSVITFYTIQQFHGYMTPRPTEHSLNIPKLFAVCRRAHQRTANVYTALMARTSKTPNFIRDPHGYTALLTGSSRVIVD